MCKIKPIDSNIVQSALKHAKSVRLCSDFRRFKLGACIFTNKRVLVGGANSNKTCPEQYKYNHFRNFDKADPRNVLPCCHAEMAALGRLKKLYPDVDPDSLSILVYREGASGHTLLAKPCKACEQALRDFGIKKVYYTDKDKLRFEYYL